MDAIFCNGDSIIWLRKTSRGWQSVHHIAAKFVSYAGERVVIDAIRNDGSTSRHRVALTSIRKAGK